MTPHRPNNPSMRGVVLLALLLGLALMGIALLAAVETWSTARQREAEAELLYIGDQYRKAIERYYLSGPRQYPRTLADLLMDPRQPGTARYLRKLYPDPVSGKDEWGLVPAPDGGIAGVYSVSENAPLKSAGFAVRDNGFEGKSKYSEWKFVYVPQQEAQPVTAPKPPA